MRRIVITPIFIALTLALVGCQGQTRDRLLNRATPQITPTPILLATEANPSPAAASASQATVSVASAATTAPVVTPTPAAAVNAATTIAPPARPAPPAADVAQPAPARTLALGIRAALTLHTLPQAGAAVAATVPGSQVLWAEARSTDGRWLFVTYDELGARAWVAATAVKLLGEPDALPAMTLETAQADLAARASATSQPAGQAATAGARASLPGRSRVAQLNVRGGPGTDQPVLGQLTADQAVAVVGRSQAGEWLAIAWRQGAAPEDEGPGWVAARYLEVTGDVAGLPILAQATTGVPSASSGLVGLSGKIAFQTAIGGDIYVVNADGSGSLRKVATGLDPAWSPAGARLAYARWDAPHGVYVLNLATGEEQRIATTERPRGPTWSSDGTRLAFSHKTGSYTCRITPTGCYPEDVIRQTFGGQECVDTPQGRYCISDFPEQSRDDTGLAQVTLADGAWLDLPSEQSTQSPDWRPRSEEILYRGKTGLQITAPGGATWPLVDNPDLSSPAWAPDGQRIAAQIYLHDHSDIFLLDAGGNIQQRLTAPASSFERAANNVAPTWSPDGRTILFLSDRAGAWRLYRMNADGTGQTRLLPQALADLSLHYDFAAERVASWGH